MRAEREEDSVEIYLQYKRNMIKQHWSVFLTGAVFYADFFLIIWYDKNSYMSGKIFCLWGCQWGRQKGVLMKKTILGFTVILLICIGGMGISPVRAYTVTVQKDGMYAETIPDAVIDNAPALFQKSVKKALKYDRKYKDADAVTRANKIEYPYDKFLDIAKKIKASDEIVIRKPFYIYTVWDQAGKSAPSEYYFLAQQNGKKLCYFSLEIDETDHKIRFSYDKLMDQYFKYDEKTMKDAIFYEIDFITYAETPDKVYEVRDQKDRGSMMAGSNRTGLEKVVKKFKQKNYSEKKDEIFDYLKDTSGISKKTEKNLKLELKDDYVESEDDSKDAGITKMIYPVIAAVCILVIAVVIFLVRKRKKNSLC